MQLTRPDSTLSALALALAIGAVAAVAGTTGAERADAALYYVSAGGDDRADGRSPARAWRSIDRVNRAALRPGDRVVFRAGQRFPGTLSPRRSGRPGKRILYSSWGRGRAKLPGGVFLKSVSHIQIDEFEIRGPQQAVAASSFGSGTRDIKITRNLLADVPIGINAPQRRDLRWTIRNNRILRTGDSGIIMEGTRAVIRDNLIAHTGRDRSIDYGKHGIYAKGPSTSVIRNRILNFADEGVSTRFRNARIMGNVIRGGPGGIAYYRNDDGHGTTHICRNSISGVDFGIYIDPDGLSNGGSERFRIILNRIHNPGGTIINAPRLRTITTRANSARRSLTRLRASCT